MLAKKEFQDKGWSLAPRDQVVPTWERRGIIEECNGDEGPSPPPPSRTATNDPPCTVVADSVLRCLPEDGTNGFFVACFVRTPVEGEEDAPPLPIHTEGGEEMTHSSRQEAFKAKARAKGGKGAPKSERGPRPARPVKEVVVVPVAKVEKVEKEKRVKQKVEGKKERYLVEKALMQKRKTQEATREGGATKKRKA